MLATMHAHPSQEDISLNLNSTSTLVRDKQLSSEIATLGDSMLTIIANQRTHHRNDCKVVLHALLGKILRYHEMARYFRDKRSSSEIVTLGDSMLTIIAKQRPHHRNDCQVVLHAPLRIDSPIPRNGTIFQDVIQ